MGEWIIGSLCGVVWCTMLWCGVVCCAAMYCAVVYCAELCCVLPLSISLSLSLLLHFSSDTLFCFLLLSYFFQKFYFFYCFSVIILFLKSICSSVFHWIFSSAQYSSHSFPFLFYPFLSLPSLFCTFPSDNFNLRLPSILSKPSLALLPLLLSSLLFSYLLFDQYMRCHTSHHSNEFFF